MTDGSLVCPRCVRPWFYRCLGPTGFAGDAYLDGCICSGVWVDRTAPLLSDQPPAGASKEVTK